MRKNKKNSKMIVVLITGFMVFVSIITIVIMMNNNKSEDNEKIKFVSDSDSISSESGETNSYETANETNSDNPLDTQSSEFELDLPDVSSMGSSSTISVIEGTNDPQSDTDSNGSKSSSKESNEETAPTPGGSDPKTVVGTRNPAKKSVWLVNKYNKLDSSYSANLGTLSNGREFDRMGIDALERMIRDCANQCSSGIWAQSTYRPRSMQESLFRDQVNKHLNNGLSQEDAEVKAATIVARPGTSEHEMGLAVDFNSVDYDFADLDVGKWMAKHCGEYGFILRYPEDKVHITGVSYEPWHFRYVGEEHSKIIMDNKICLEEYYVQYPNNVK